MDTAQAAYPMIKHLGLSESRFTEIVNYVRDNQGTLDGQDIADWMLDKQFGTVIDIEKENEWLSKAPIKEVGGVIIMDVTFIKYDR